MVQIWRQRARLCRFLGPYATGLLVFWAGQSAWVPCAQAENAEPNGAIEQRVFGPSGDAALDARAQTLGRTLRCPVCQGMPIAESPATMAIDMMQQVRKMLAAGQSDAAIVAYFTSRYGQWVLLEPPHDGFALWVWVLPPLVSFVLLAWALRIVWRLRAQAASASTVAPPTPHQDAPAPPDPDAAALMAAIRREVDLS